MKNNRRLNLGNAYYHFVHNLTSRGGDKASEYSRKEEGAEEGILAKERGSTGGWPELHNEELHDSYSTPNIL
jgi:hypothetical protein